MSAAPHRAVTASTRTGALEAQDLGPAPPIVESTGDAVRFASPPLLIREPLRALLDRNGLGSGPLRAELISEGRSTVTFRLRRRGLRAILRRPPRRPLAVPNRSHPLHEARVLRAVGLTIVRVPRVLLTHEQPDVLGAPFYLMEDVQGEMLTSPRSRLLSTAAGGSAVADELIAGLAEIHELDPASPALIGLGQPDGFAARQLRTWTAIWSSYRTRDVTAVDEVGRWLRAHRPPPRATALVHGDYRLGNLVFSQDAPAQLVGVLDWEIAALGDPLFDLGWLLSSWPEPGEDGRSLLLLGAETAAGVPTRAELAARYAARMSTSIADLTWYLVFAYWRAAIGLETLNRGPGAAEDPFRRVLMLSVPQLAERARTTIATGI